MSDPELDTGVVAVPVALLRAWAEVAHDTAVLYGRRSETERLAAGFNQRALPVLVRAEELMLRDVRAATDAADAAGYARGYAAGVADGVRTTHPPAVPPHHHLAAAVLDPLTTAFKSPLGRSLIAAAGIAVLTLIGAACAWSTRQLAVFTPETPAEQVQDAVHE